MNNRYNHIEGSSVCCESCGSTSKLEYHHIIRQCDGGNDDSDNIMVLCSKCHKQPHMLEGDFKKWGKQGGNKIASTFGPVYMSLLAKRKHNKPGKKGVTKKMLEKAKRDFLKSKADMLISKF